MATGYPSWSAASTASSALTKIVGGIATPYVPRSWRTTSGASTKPGDATYAAMMSAAAPRSRPCGGVSDSPSSSALRHALYQRTRARAADACSGKAKLGTEEPSHSGPSPNPSITATTGLSAPLVASSMDAVCRCNDSSVGGACTTTSASTSAASRAAVIANR